MYFEKVKKKKIFFKNCKNTFSKKLNKLFSNKT